MTTNDDSDNKVLSLDDSEVEKKFYFRSDNSSLVYDVSLETAKLSYLFATILDQNKTGSDAHEKALPLQLIRHNHETNPGVFTINNDRLLKYVDKYFKIWETKTSDANYIKDDVPVQTGDVSNILNAKDLALIREYLSDSTVYLSECKVSGYDDFTIDRFIHDTNYNLAITLQLLNELLSQVDGYLGIESFANKIFVYIAALIWETTILDANNISNGGWFTKMQNDAITTWNKNHPDGRSVVGDTTGNADEVDADVDEVDADEVDADADEVDADEVDADEVYAN